VSARIVEVIEVVTTRGDGKETPIREVTRYFDRDGKLLSESDHLLDAVAGKVATKSPVDVADHNLFVGMFAEKLREAAR
jgi:hypothetical protein